MVNVERPNPSELAARLRELPAAHPLVYRLGDQPGLFLVGGAVRDLLLGGRPFDLDLVVEGDPAIVLARLDGTAIVYDRFGTSTVSVDGFTYDVARARTETYRAPGALPEVTPASLDEDLRRRDFTVNAIALPLRSGSAGGLPAVPGALEDLDARRLRVLHDRSFIDDPTRLLRLARYRARLGFEIEDHTLALAREAVAQDALKTLSGPRIGNELRLLAREHDPVGAFAALRELGLDRSIDPRFGLQDDAVATEALALLPVDGNRDRLVLAVAGERLPADELRRLLDQLGFEAEDREGIVAAAKRAPGVADELAAARAPSQVATAALGLAPEVVALAGALGPADAAKQWLERLRHVELEIDGRDLLAAGIEQGPAVGFGLRAALVAKLDGRVHSRQEELAVALEAARGAG